MKLLIAGRGAGKTTKMLYWLAENPDAVCVVISYAEKDRLVRLAPTIRPERFIVADNLQAMAGLPYRQVGIDNVDIFLQRMFTWKLGLVTLSDNDD